MQRQLQGHVDRAVWWPLPVQQLLSHNLPQLMWWNQHLRRPSECQQAHLGQLHSLAVCGLTKIRDVIKFKDSQFITLIFLSHFHHKCYWHSHLTWLLLAKMIDETRKWECLNVNQIVFVVGQFYWHYAGRSRQHMDLEIVHDFVKYMQPALYQSKG